MNRSIDVSVVIPTYNRQELLHEAISSCFIGNDGIVVDVIVVDDDSDDGTRRYLKDLNDSRVTAIFQDSGGPQRARNKGLEVASGRYIKFLDDDDILAPGALASEVARLDDTAALYSFGDLIIREPEGDWRFDQSGDPDPVSGILQESIWTHPPTFLYRRDCLNNLRWDPALPYHQDYDFALRAACQLPDGVQVATDVAVIRRHSGERMADRKRATPLADYHRKKVDLINTGIDLLRKNRRLEDHHCTAAAEGIWTWAHIIAGYDVETFNEFYTQALDIAPDFDPPRRRFGLQALDALLGAAGTERFLYPFRRLKNLIWEPRTRSSS